MKVLASLILVGVLCGCAVRKTQPPTKIQVPRQCVLGGVVNVTKCKMHDANTLICDGVLIDFACIEVMRQGK